jgi:mevalonate kinase
MFDMKTAGRTFFGKILLFGEYSVICEGRALTIPLTQFQARFRYPGEEYDPKHRLLNQQLKDYLLGLVRQEETDGLDHFIDLNVFALDLLKGMFLESDIPNGYGAGSSGALVASVYERYARDLIPDEPVPVPKKMQRLQKILARLEAYFHGTSSGIDPLSCYLGLPLLIDAEKGPRPVKIPVLPFRENGGFFLTDTLLPRKTESLVSCFFEKYKKGPYRKMIHEIYIPLVDFCLDALLHGRQDEISRGIRHLSSMQMMHFREMIPAGYEKIWNEGLETGDFSLKLCGAGGGGFLLGFTENYEKAKRILEKTESPMLPIELPH